MQGGFIWNYNGCWSPPPEPSLKAAERVSVSRSSFLPRKFILVPLRRAACVLAAQRCVRASWFSKSFLPLENFLCVC